ncbi:MAG TPA: HAMP domain-containing sensor histidine kinase [Longimicrobium sp.]|nr:HAMP domain-containing sensor histidine kinase [Longimicrobium sp.]
MITDTASLAPTSADEAHPAAARSAPEGGALALRANKLDLLERLADDLAHEIKNPLHSMVINLEVLKRRVSRAGAEEDVQRYIGVLTGELERVNRRIELLLRLSRPGRGAEATTLNELTEELMELVQLEARHHELTVDYRPDGRIARVFVSREPTRQVILNLVLETIDRIEAGGTLVVRIDERDGWSRIAVGGGAGEPPDSARIAVARALAADAGGRVEPDGEAEGGPALVFSVPVSR